MTEQQSTEVLRKLAWDILPCLAVRIFMPALGLVPGSDDITELEHRDSHQRLARLAPISGVLTEQAELMGKVITALMLRLDDGDNLDPNIVQAVFNQNTVVVYAGLCAGIAQLLDDGTLQIGRG